MLSAATQRAFLREVADRPANDALRAAVVETLLELAPETGAEAWLDLLSDCEDDLRTPPIGMLLVSAGRAAPPEAAGRFPTEDRMSKAIAELVMTAPEGRLEAAIAAIELGHRPTMLWAIMNPEAPLDQRVLDVALQRFFAFRKGQGFRKPPSTSELVDWLTVLVHAGLDADAIRDEDPYLGVLFKQESDLNAAVRRRRQGRA